MKEDKGNKNSQKLTENYPASERRCVIDGKRFLIIRHFKGNGQISDLMTELAVSRADRESGL